MDVILVIAAFQALLMVALIQTKKAKSISDQILSVMFLVNALTLFFGFMEIYNRKNGYPYPVFINASTPFILLHGPLLWFYIRSLTYQHFRFKPVHLLHFLPFIIIFIRFTLTMYFLPAAIKIEIETSEAFKNDFFFPLTVAAIAISTQGYYVWGLLMIRAHEKRIKAYFSRTENIDLRWLKFLIITAIIFYASISTLYAIDYAFSLMPYSALQLTGFSFASFYILVLGFYGHRQGNIFTSQKLEIDLHKATSEVQESTLNSEEEKFIRRLLDYMIHQKPFLDPELTLSLLSNQLRVTSEYLSAILNTRLKKNFFDFINHYRVEEFKARCKDPASRNLKLLSIAFDCGFNSKATFNRVFKNTTGLTPSEYMEGITLK